MTANRDFGQGPSDGDIAGRYHVLGEYARGGLGRIVKARDRQLDRTVAIKELIEPSPAAESLFMREAMITARLQHPGVVPVVEAGRWSSGEPYYVMKLVSGHSLQALIASKSTLDARLALLPNVIAVVETVAYAHSQGVVHRDIKPANVMVGEFGETVVIDWGLAHDRASATDGDGHIAGTPAYMSPEQARGEPVDERDDIYALGALLYDVLAGQPPYPGKRSRAVLTQVSARPPLPITAHDSGVPAELASIVETAMARDRDQRYSSAKKLAEELRRFETGQLVLAHRYSTWARIKRRLWRHRGAALVAALAIVALTVGAIVGVTRVIEERNLARAEGVLARAAQRSAEQRRNELVLLQAASALERDPTLALAWLKQVPLDGRLFVSARQLFEQAVARGVARHSFAHRGWVSDVRFTATSEHLISASKDGTLRLLDVASGAQQIVAKNRRGFDAVAISPDGVWIASNGGDRDVWLWRLADVLASPDEPIAPRVLTGHEDRVYRLRFSADSRRLVTRSADGVGIVWDVAAMTPIAELAVTDASEFSSDARRAFFREIASGQRHVATIDVATGGEIDRLSLPTMPRSLLVTPDETRLAIYGHNGWMWLADLTTGEVTKLDRVPRMQAATPMAFSPGGDLLAAGGDGFSVQVWDLSTGDHRVLRGHTDAIFDLAFSSDGSLLVSASDDGTVRAWDLASKSVHVLRGHGDDVMRVAICPASSLVATASKDGHVRVWPIESNPTNRLSGHAGDVSGLALTAPNTLIATTRNGEVRRWDVAAGTGEPLAPARADVDLYRSFVSPNGRWIAAFDRAARVIELLDVRTDRRVALRGHGAPVHHIAYADDDRWMASTDRMGGFALWSLTGEPAGPVMRADDVCGSAVSPDGDELLLIRPDRIELRDIARDRVVDTIALPGSIEWCRSTVRVYASYAPDGRAVAVAASPWGIALWDRETRATRWLDVGSYLVNAMRFSPDSAWLVAGVHDRSVRLWDVASGAARVLGHHTDMVMDVAFSPDATLVASASYDRTMWVWNLDTGRKRHLRDHDGSVDRLVFSADGRRLISGSRDRTVRLWDIDMDAVSDPDTLTALMRAITTAVISPDNRAETPR